MQFRALYPCQFYLLLLPGAWRNESHAVTAARRRRRRRRIAAARRIRILQPLGSSLPKKLLRQLEKTLLFFLSYRRIECKAFQTCSENIFSDLSSRSMRAALGSKHTLSGQR